MHGVLCFFAAVPRQVGLKADLQAFAYRPDNPPVAFFIHETLWPTGNMKLMTSGKWLILATVLLALLGLGLQLADVGQRSGIASGKPHQLVLQVSDDDPRKWNLTLINARNVQKALGTRNVAIEIVVYGPAIDMLRIESEVGPGVDEAIKSGIKLVACENTMHGLHLTPADMLPDIDYTRTGVAYLMEKQEQGYAYVRP